MPIKGDFFSLISYNLWCFTELLTTGFTITGNEFTDMVTCIKTSSCNSATSTISENLFYKPDTALLFKDDAHNSLLISCNGFVDYAKYGIYATGGSLRNQGTSDAGAGNFFMTSSTQTNHQLYFTGTGGMNYYCDPSNAFTLDTRSPKTAIASTASQNGSCSTITGRLAGYGIEPKELYGTSYNKSRLINCIPNPTADKTTFTYNLADNAKTAEIRISNLFGEIVSKLQLANDSREAEANVSNFTNGIYFYTLIVNGNIVDSKKLVIAK